MKTIAIAPIVTSVVLALCSVSLAQAGEGEPGSVPRGGAPAEVTNSSESTIASANSQSASGQTWRYRPHQGLWWYWLPSEKWVIWSNGKWVPYDPASFAQLQATRRGRTTAYRGSNSGNPELGKWGPVRYNSYGQREYPYSRRNSGIRQLGPVPAMGGVRAMPGWGGER